MNVLHISDLHFGPRHWEGDDQILLEKLNSYDADIVINTGDSTTDGLEDEYAAAGRFLKGIKCKDVISVIGNHDKRNMRSHELFQKYIYDSKTIFIPEIDAEEVIADLLIILARYDEAEAAYRQSLEMETQTNNRAGQATSLGQLGNLYHYNLQRLEEAVTFYRQAVEIDLELDDLKNEGIDRNNIASTLHQLKRYDEARQEIMRAIECDRKFGHAAEPWKTFAILHQIETAEGKMYTRAEWIRHGAADIVRGGTGDVGGITPLMDVKCTIHRPDGSSEVIRACKPEPAFFCFSNCSSESCNNICVHY